MDRIVLDDCQSEQVRALVEEHNKVVDVLKVLAIKQKGVAFIESAAFPRKIIKEG